MTNFLEMLSRASSARRWEDSSSSHSPNSFNSSPSPHAGEGRGEGRSFQRPSTVGGLGAGGGPLPSFSSRRRS